METRLSEVELRWWFPWRGELPTRPSPSRQFPMLGTPVRYQQGYLGWVRVSALLGPASSWVSGLLWKSCPPRRLCLLLPGGLEYFLYDLCRHSTGTRIYCAKHLVLYASIFPCLFRYLAWLVESPLAQSLSPRGDLWLRLQD